MADRDTTEYRAFLVMRTDDVGYDEYDAFVVVASDPDDARVVALERFSESRLEADQREAFRHAEVTEIDLTVRGEVLGSFNAG